MTNTAIFIIINIVLDLAIVAALAAAMRLPFRLLREPNAGRADGGREAPRGLPARRRAATAARPSQVRV